ncbi:hypothetical protein [Streptomyces sp. NPDC005485]|uniref:hypothetical protein n=1 Tax=Streptomyces sp. NPDC005485 TaxID=3155591 RepID=UPI0033AD20B5
MHAGTLPLDAYRTVIALDEPFQPADCHTPPSHPTHLVHAALDLLGRDPAAVKAGLSTGDADRLDHANARRLLRAVLTVRAPGPLPAATAKALDTLLAAERQAHEITDAGTLPRCPNCGGQVEINVRIGPEFVDAPYLAAGRRLQGWLDTADADTRLLILEFGAGFNTPGVIRWPGEQLTRSFPRARFVRVNPTDPETPADLADRSLSVPTHADHLLATRTAPHSAPDPTVIP